MEYSGFYLWLAFYLFEYLTNSFANTKFQMKKSLKQKYICRVNFLSFFVILILRFYEKSQNENIISSRLFNVLNVLKND